MLQVVANTDDGACNGASDTSSQAGPQKYAPAGEVLALGRTEDLSSGVLLVLAQGVADLGAEGNALRSCLLYTSPSPRD